MNTYEGLIHFSTKRLLDGCPRKQIYELAMKYFGYKRNYHSFDNYLKKVLYRHLKQTITYHKNDIDFDIYFLEIMRKFNKLTVNDIFTNYGIPIQMVKDIIIVLNKQGYEIEFDGVCITIGLNCISATGRSIPHHPFEEQEIIFAIASDLHFGSIACQITALHEFCETCKQNNVKYIFVPGDVLAGHNVYKGQIFELYATTADEQENSLLENLPYGFEWYMLGGNHDYSFIKNGGGHNPLRVLEEGRKDIHYLGFDEADIPILKNVDMRLWHPSGGLSYAMSYRAQRAVEQIALQELQHISSNLKDRPTIKFLFLGHLHIQMQMMIGGIMTALCGTFEGETSYIRRKGLLTPSVGGWIVKASIRDNNFDNFEARFHFAKHLIKDDWKHYNHPGPYSPKVINKPIMGR